jgi:hypothetical protein
MRRKLLCITAAALLAGHAAAMPASDPYEAGRKAILATVGDFRAGFHFQETVELDADYVRKPGDDSVGYEAVIVVEDTGRRIVLQHLLVSDTGHVTKHWRQDWTYEATQRFEFSADQTFSRVALSPDATKGKWTECVFEVSDAPRYCGTGAWVPGDGHPTWTSDVSWRPLPRREYTTRTDYNALAVVNRYTVTPAGWTHEQDNTKQRRAADGSLSPLVREFGLNDYLKAGKYDFAPAYAYWDKTKGYWARVRALWQQRLDAGDALVLKMKVDGMPLIMGTFEQADQVEAGKTVSDADIAALFDTYTAVLPEANAKATAGR